jgi:hypothetical protein
MRACFCEMALALCHGNSGHVCVFKFERSARPAQHAKRQPTIREMLELHIECVLILQVSLVNTLAAPFLFVATASAQARTAHIGPCLSVTIVPSCRFSAAGPEQRSLQKKLCSGYLCGSISFSQLQDSQCLRWATGWLTRHIESHPKDSTMTTRRNVRFSVMNLSLRQLWRVGQPMHLYRFDLTWLMT